MNNNGLSDEKEPAFKNLFTERQEFGKSLITFLENSDDEDRVISIDADWGFGKTTFLTELNKGLIEKDFTVFTYNAWKNDYEQDPLKCFISELIPQMMQAVGYNKESDKNKEEIVKNVLLGANEILRFLTPIDIIKYKKELKGKKEFITEELGEKDIDLSIYEENSSPLFKAQKQFEKRLNEIYDEIEKQKDEANKNKKIVILIDELDRCRPTFAVELLERIKHLFDTGKYLFIFTVCAKQLKESVKQIYGNGYEETGYFRRFFDYEFYLPEPNLENYHLLEKEYSNKIGNNEFTKIAFSLINDNKPSLREYKTIIKFLNLIKKINNKKEFMKFEIAYLSFFCFLKFYEPQIFEYLLQKKVKTNIDLSKFMNSNFIFSKKYFIYDEEGNETQKNLNITFSEWAKKFSKIKLIDQEYQTINKIYEMEIKAESNKYKFSFYSTTTSWNDISTYHYYMKENASIYKKLNSLLLFGSNQIESSENH